MKSVTSVLCRSARARAFTLVELLVVIAVIAIIAGIGAFSLGGNTGGGAAMQGAQGNILSLVSAVRATAALQNQNAALFVNVDPTTDGFLRELQLAYDTTGSNNWRARGAPIILPNGVYIVPDSSSAGAGTYADPANVEFIGTWNAGSWDLRSTAMPSAASVQTVRDDNNNAIGTKYLRLCQLKPVGQSVGTVGKISVAPASRQGTDKIVFDKPEAVRGVMVSVYGVSALLNDQEAMK